MRLTPENQDFGDSRPIRKGYGEKCVPAPDWVAELIRERRAALAQKSREK